MYNKYIQYIYFTQYIAYMYIYTYIYTQTINAQYVYNKCSIHINLPLVCRRRKQWVFTNIIAINLVMHL